MRNDLLPDGCVAIEENVMEGIRGSRWEVGNIPIAHVVTEGAGTEFVNRLDFLNANGSECQQRDDSSDGWLNVRNPENFRGSY